MVIAHIDTLPFRRFIALIVQFPGKGNNYFPNVQDFQPLFAIVNLRFRPINQKKALCGTREGSIEPVQVVGSEHVVSHVTLVDIDMRPLTALCLVTSDGIGELHLQGIVVAILLQLVQAVLLQRDVRVVVHHAVVELLLLLAGQRRRV